MEFKATLSFLVIFPVGGVTAPVVAIYMYATHFEKSRTSPRWLLFSSQLITFPQRHMEEHKTSRVEMNLTLNEKESKLL